MTNTATDREATPAPSRYDPLAEEPGKAYARCNDCGLVLDTSELASEHMSATVEPVKGATSGVVAHGHSIHITNPTREQRIDQQVNSEIDSALYDLIDEFFKLQDRLGITDEEMTAALRRGGSVDLHEAWQDALEEREE